MLTNTLDGGSIVEINTSLARTDAALVITLLLGRTRCDITWSKVTEGWILPLEVVIAILFRNITRSLVAIFLLLRSPATTVVPQRFGHQCQLRLMITGLWNTGRVDLGVTGIGEESTLLGSFPGSGDATTHGVCRQVEDVDVTTSCQTDSIAPE